MIVGIKLLACEKLFMQCDAQMVKLSVHKNDMLQGVMKLLLHKNSMFIQREVNILSDEYVRERERMRSQNQNASRWSIAWIPIAL